ncbi:GYD domain-containing protein [Micromonospora sp. NBC_01739]|uniref:GYD domain-containing protein n=1 Tax=Micromonospora sp. NBC_01739 TaxID=2975985 RepID=UPI002E13A701|nr:GYD domain-containing protein [Micromonospora sp. NBC_01739]
MAKYLLAATYQGGGLEGLTVDGGTVRVEVVRSLIENAGGQLELMYFSFGEYDTYVLFDMPDHVTATAMAIAVRVGGLVNGRLIPLLTPEQIDAAVNLPIAYQQPGR